MKLFRAMRDVINRNGVLKNIFPYTLMLFTLISLSIMPLYAAEDAENAGEKGISAMTPTDSSTNKLSWEYCRNNADEKEMVICLEKGIYDPCDDASSGDRSYWTAQCAWAHYSLSEKNIIKYENQIKERLIKNKQGTQIYTVFKKSEDEWRIFRNNYCNFSNDFSEYSDFDVTNSSQYDFGYCLRRLAEQHEKELLDILKHDSQ